jgi:hypothetical protein
VSAGHGLASVTISKIFASISRPNGRRHSKRRADRAKKGRASRLLTETVEPPSISLGLEKTL